MNDLDRLLQKMIDLNASDLHLNHNAPISFRVDGLIKQTEIIIDQDSIYELLTRSGAIKSEQQKQYSINKSVDFAYTSEALDRLRFRGSLIKQKGKHSCVFRKINTEPPRFEDMGLPEVVENMINSNWGLVLVTGPTGSGKSTTLASMIDYINEKNQYHIATIEHPLEYVHKNKNSIVTQREVGRDTPNFAESMKDVLRQDPDVILIGEMRDFETVTAAISNAETGHLVFGTLHTNTAPHSITRMLSFFPQEQHFSIRNQIADSLKGILNQRLLPKPGGGRTAVHEVLVVDDGMRELIREGKTNELYPYMERNRKKGNLIMTDSINWAKQKGLIYPNVQW